MQTCIRAAELQSANICRHVSSIDTLLEPAIHKQESRHRGALKSAETKLFPERQFWRVAWSGLARRPLDVAEYQIEVWEAAKVSPVGSKLTFASSVETSEKSDVECQGLAAFMQWQHRMVIVYVDYAAYFSMLCLVHLVHRCYVNALSAEVTE